MLDPIKSANHVLAALSAIDTGLSLWQGATGQEEQIFNDDGSNPLVRQVSIESDRLLALDASYTVTDTFYRCIVVLDETPDSQAIYWLSGDAGDTYSKLEFISYEKKTGYFIIRFKRLN
jgi:hypothetical protein